MDKGKRNRTRNYSEREKCLLLALVKEFSHIIDNKATDASTVRMKNQTWFQITGKYNEEADSGERRVDQLKTLYDNLKRKARKGMGFENTEMYSSKLDHPQIIRIQAALDEKEDNSKVDLLPESDGQRLAFLNEQFSTLTDSYDDKMFHRRKKNFSRRLGNSEHLKRLYFRKKLQIAQLEYISKRKLHLLDVQIKKLEIDILRKRNAMLDL